MKETTKTTETPIDGYLAVNGSIESDPEMYDDEYYEGQPDESCPKCGRDYDDIDFDFQSCSKCGWDAEKESFDNEIVREPSDEDFMNGDADLLSGEWL